MNRYVIASKHPAFGKMYLGRNRPVYSKSAALTFGSKESARERIAFWQGLVEKDNLDPKFFGGMYVEEK
jgi:hypothetical protein